MSSSLKRWVTSGSRSTRPEAIDVHQAAHALLAAGAKRRDDRCGRRARPQTRRAGSVDPASRRRGWTACRRAEAPAAHASNVCLRAQRLDRDVHPATVREPHDLLDRVTVLEVDDVVGAEPRRDGQPLGNACRPR